MGDKPSKPNPDLMEEHRPINVKKQISITKNEKGEFEGVILNLVIKYILGS